jgi:hypothetical protein
MTAVSITLLVVGIVLVIFGGLLLISKKLQTSDSDKFPIFQAPGSVKVTGPLGLVVIVIGIFCMLSSPVANKLAGSGNVATPSPNPTVSHSSSPTTALSSSSPVASPSTAPNGTVTNPPNSSNVAFTGPVGITFSGIDFDSNPPGSGSNDINWQRYNYRLQGYGSVIVSRYPSSGAPPAEAACRSWAQTHNSQILDGVNRGDRLCFITQDGRTVRFIVTDITDSTVDGQATVWNDGNQ